MRILPLLLLLALCTKVVAQRGISEIGITGGVTYYIGDLNPYKHYPARTKPGGGIMYRYNFNTRYAMRVQALYSVLESFDSDSPDTLQQLRNLSFRTSLFELSTLFEINFFNYRGVGKEGRTWTPYLFAGIAYFRTNPKATLNGTLFELQPLGTEGQGSVGRPGTEPYKLDQVCLPFGAGLKFNFGGKLDLQLEWGMRRTYTDHIDDVSGVYADPATLNPLAAQLSDPSLDREIRDRSGTARGDANTRDWYNYTGITLSWVLTRFEECDQLYFRNKR